MNTNNNIDSPSQPSPPSSILLTIIVLLWILHSGWTKGDQWTEFLDTYLVPLLQHPRVILFGPTVVLKHIANKNNLKYSKKHVKTEQFDPPNRYLHLHTPTIQANYHTSTCLNRIFSSNINKHMHQYTWPKCRVHLKQINIT